MVLKLPGKPGTNGNHWRFRDLFFLLPPADDRVRHAVDRGEIRFDVQERRAVQAIEADHRELIAVNAEQLDHAHGDRVGPRRRAQGEGAALHAGMARHLQHQIARRLIHPIKQDQVRDGLDLFEALGPARVEFDRADRVRATGVFRAVLALCPRRVDAADEIDLRIGACRQGDGLFTIAGAEILVF